MTRTTKKLFVLLTSLALLFPALTLPTAVHAERISEQKKEAKKRPKKKKKKKRKRRRKKEKEAAADPGGSIDLSSLNESGRPKGRPRGSGSGPMFKAFFDLLLTYRPNNGSSAVTFDNFHPVLLFDYMPDPSITFSSEVRPTPRFYEVNWKVSKRLTLRLGKIWIPFDNSHPHQTFGGLMNTTEFSEGVAFLPDLWADLGFGFKLRLVDRPGMQIDVDGYMVNGFGDAGASADPLGDSSIYPNFSDTALGNDNNDAKSFGGRIYGLFGHMVGVGISAYTGLYSTNGVPNPGNILALGIDTQIRLPSKTDIRLGYVYMNCTLASNSGTGRGDMLRAGFYSELRQRFGRKFSVLGRIGVVQPDNAVISVDDRTIVGGRIAYNFNPMLQLAFEQFFDLESTPGKTNGQYTGFRFVVKM